MNEIKNGNLNGISLCHREMSAPRQDVLPNRVAEQGLRVLASAGEQIKESGYGKSPALSNLEEVSSSMAEAYENLPGESIQSGKNALAGPLSRGLRTTLRSGYGLLNTATGVADALVSFSDAHGQAKAGCQPDYRNFIVDVSVATLKTGAASMATGTAALVLSTAAAPVMVVVVGAGAAGVTAGYAVEKGVEGLSFIAGKLGLR